MKTEMRKRITANAGLVIWFQLVYWLTLAIVWALIGEYKSLFGHATF